MRKPQIGFKCGEDIEEIAEKLKQLKPWMGKRLKLQLEILLRLKKRWK